jgi:hypothetical protein
MPVITSKPVEQMNLAELRAHIAQLEDEKRKTQTLSFKIGEKGGVSVYGMGRFPVTLYYEQWVRLFAAKDRIMAFMEENKEKLASKADRPVVPKAA